MNISKNTTKISDTYSNIVKVSEQLELMLEKSQNSFVTNLTSATTQSNTINGAMIGMSIIFFLTSLITLRVRLNQFNAEVQRTKKMFLMVKKF